ncbi:MAG: tetratricopeptide repeat protein [Brevundimonas sp.]|uniref:tetratricopeptide repeat protein n=1 Tax=Brevundimonas sp. TaxID=1871086 RepID=UPI004034F481
MLVAVAMALSLPQVDCAAAQTTDGPPPTPAARRPFTPTDRGIAAFERGDWVEAEREFTAALKPARLNARTQRDTLLISLENLALTRERRGNYRGAEPLRAEALTIRRERDGGAHVDTLTATMNLAYARHAGLGDASLLFLSVLRARQAKGDWAGASEASLGLAYARAKAARFPEADHAAGVALEFAERAADPDVRRIALLGFGAVLTEAGRYAEAEARAQEALNGLPSDASPILRGRILGVIGTARQQQGRYAEAAEIQNEAIHTLEGQDGGGRIELAGAVNDLAIIRDHQLRLADAEFLYRRALALTTDPVETAAYTSNLGWNLHQQDRHEEAERLLRQAAESYDRLKGRLDPDGASAWTNLAGELQSQGRDAEAVPIFRDALARYEKTLGRSHATVGWTLNAMARSIAATGGEAEAERLFREALILSEARRPPGHPEITRQSGDLADLLIRTRRAEEALPLLRRVGADVLTRTGAQPETGAGSDARRELDRDRRLFRLQVQAAWAAHDERPSA